MRNKPTKFLPMYWLPGISAQVLPAVQARLVGRQDGRRRGRQRDGGLGLRRSQAGRPPRRDLPGPADSQLRSPARQRQLGPGISSFDFGADGKTIGKKLDLEAMYRLFRRPDEAVRSAVGPAARKGRRHHRLGDTEKADFRSPGSSKAIRKVLAATAIDPAPGAGHLQVTLRGGLLPRKREKIEVAAGRGSPPLRSGGGRLPNCSCPTTPSPAAMRRSRYPTSRTIGHGKAM